MNALIGQKTEQLQRFLEDGKRIPVTVIRVPEVSVTQLKSIEKEGYSAAQLGIASRKPSKANKSLTGHMKKSGAKAPLFLQEIRLAEDEVLPELGSTLNAAEILEAGDLVWVTGTSKGKGFAGGVKRYGFRGGPRTHGQSDRERAPGSIGQTTTPGRVYKGKRMAGNMGNDQVTVQNLLVVNVDQEKNTIMVAGLVPGLIGSYVKVVKMGAKKNFTPLLPNPAEQAIIDAEAAKAAEEQAKLDAEAAKAQAEAEKAAAEEKAVEEAKAAEEASKVVEQTENTPSDAAAAPVEEATEVEVPDAPVVEEQAEASEPSADAQTMDDKKEDSK